MKNMRINYKGQSVAEYVVVFTIVIVASIVMLPKISPIFTNYVTNATGSMASSPASNQVVNLNSVVAENDNNYVLNNDGIISGNSQNLDNTDINIDNLKLQRIAAGSTGR